MRGKIYTLGGMDHFEFQQDAIERLIFRSKELLNREKAGKLKDKDRRVLLYAPVGSGKTVMATTYMEYLPSELGEDIAFVWLSPGEGGLHTQSEDSAKYMSQNTNVMDVQKILTQKCFKPNDVLFMNWESLRQDGNVLRKEGEDTYLAECVRNTEGVKIVVMVDEAHRARNKEVIDLFDPVIEIDITATPRLGNYTDNNIIDVDIQDVISEGLIKKQTHINVGISQNDENTLLNEAIRKREEIERRYEEKTTNRLKPLVLIQISNNTRDTDTSKEQEMVERVKESLMNKGVNPDKIGVWLSNQHENIEEDIRTSDIEFLIFKQAIATGWDCPRSHILVRLRDIKTETFDLQTIGRILRTVERKHYGDNLLDTAYILTEYETVSYAPTTEFADKILTEKNRAVLKESFKDKLGVIELPMSKVRHDMNYVVDTKELREYIEKGLNNETIKNMGIKEKFLEGHFESVEIDSKDILTGGESKRHVNTFEKTQYKIDRLFDSYIDKVYRKIDIKRMVLNALKKATEGRFRAGELRKLYVSNRVEIEMYLESAITKYEAYARGKIRQDIESKFNIPEEVFYANIGVDIENYTYTKRPDLRVNCKGSRSEEPFARWLQNQENVEYWFKNGTSITDFSVVYTDSDNMYKNYFPDFFVIVKKEGKRKLYILDVKGMFGSGDIDKKQVELKYCAGRDYEKKVRGELGDNIDEIEFSLIKFSDKDFKLPFICKAEAGKYSDEIVDWEAFEV